MTNKRNEKRHSLTLTSGNMKDLATEYERLKIRGAVTFQKDVHLKEISSHGHSSFQSHVIANTLKNSGSCVIKGNCEIEEIINTGNLKIKSGHTTKIRSSGKLTIEHDLQSEQLKSNGIIQANEIHAKHIRLKLSGQSTIEQLIAEEAYVEKERKTFSLRKKKLICKHIKGGNLHLSNTVAEVVEGDVVVISNHCHIQTLYYREHYTVSSNAKVHQIIRSEK